MRNRAFMSMVMHCVLVLDGRALSMVMHCFLSLTAPQEPLYLGGDKCYVVVFKHLVDAKRAISDITQWPEPWKVESGD